MPVLFRCLYLCLEDEGSVQAFGKTSDLPAAAEAIFGPPVRMVFVTPLVSKVMMPLSLLQPQLRRCGKLSGRKQPPSHRQMVPPTSATGDCRVYVRVELRHRCWRDEPVRAGASEPRTS